MTVDAENVLRMTRILPRPLRAAVRLGCENEGGVRRDTSGAVAQETGRPFGTSRTAHRPELVSLKKTWPLWGCAPHTIVAFGV